VLPADQPPYPGLRPFERDESHLFFGRDHCVDDMVQRLAKHRFLAVLGSSGSGKSSLVKTGLFSALEMGLLAGAGSRWLIVDFRPGDNPLGNLARALLEAEHAAKKKPRPADAEVASLQRRFEQDGPRALIKWCRSGEGEGHLAEVTNLLVLVDQFEELFRNQNADERNAAQMLVSLLLESRWPRGLESPQRAAVPIYVTITMRSEYLGACALIQGLAEAINEGTYLTPRMKRRECEEAILGPARVCGLDVEPALVTRLLNDLADFAPWDADWGKDQWLRLARSADQLPLMQHALNKMWQRASWQKDAQAKGNEDEIVLRLADYRGLEEELDHHAEEVFASLDASEQATAEHIFRAVTQGTTVANAVRRPTRYGPGMAASGPQQPHDGTQGGQPQDGQSQLVEAQFQTAQPRDRQDNLIDICGGEPKRNAVERVLATFGPHGCQFLTANPKPADRQSPTDNALIDIAHESLIRQWKRLSGGKERRKQLRGWLVEEGEAAGLWQRLKDQAENNEWLKSPIRQWNRLSGGKELCGSDSRGWLVEEGEDAGLWQRLKDRAEKNEWLTGRILQEAIRFRNKSQPTPAWAQRYGGEFDRVDRFIKKSRRRENGLFGFSCIIGFVLVGLVAYGLLQRLNAAQEHSKAIGLSEQAVSSAQALVNKIGEEGGHGDVTTKGAVELLNVAAAIVAKAATPENPAPLITLEQTRSDVYGDIGQYKEAFDEAQKARDTAKPLSAAKPDDKEALQLLYDSIWRMADGIYFRDGKTDPAALEQSLALYREAQKLALRLKELSPDGAHDRALMFIHTKIGRVLHENLQKFDDANREFQTALDYIQGALKEQPNNRGWKRDLGVTQRWLAKALAARKDSGGAIRQFDIAVNTLAELAAGDSNDTVTWSNLAAADREIGDFYQSQNEFDKAVGQYSLAIKIQSGINAKDQANTSWIAPLAISHAAAGSALKQLGKLTDALGHFENAKEFRTQLYNKDPASHDRQSDLITAYIQFAKVATELAQALDAEARKVRLNDAVAVYEQAIQVLDQLMPRDDTGVFTSYTRIGDIRMLQNDPSSALSAYRGAFEIARAIAGKGESADWQGRLGDSYTNIGDVLAKQANTGHVLAAQDLAREASEQYRKALDIVTMLSAKSPQSTAWTAKAEQLSRKIQDLVAKPAQDAPAPQTEPAQTEPAQDSRASQTGGSVTGAPPLRAQSAAPKASPVPRSPSTRRRP
jgi:tetratricopeptide (TPR) repeat protein